MKSDRHIAKRYARAFLHEKLDRATFEAMTAETGALVGVLRSGEKIREFFASPAYSRDKKLKVVGNMVTKLGMSSYTLALLEMLIRRDRMAILESVSEELQAAVDEMNNRIRVRVTTAYEPSMEDLKEITERISAFFGREAVVDRVIDPSIVGGFTIEGDDKLVDMSVMGQIRRALSNV